MVNRVDRKTATKKKSGFKYEYRSDESVKKHAERPLGNYDSIFKGGIDKYRSKVGDNLIRILPPTWETKEHFGFPIHLHKYVGQDNGSYLCPRKMKGKKCPICEMATESENAGDKDEAKALKVKEDFIYWILDRNSDSEYSPIVWQQSAQADREVVALTRQKGRKAAGTLYIDHPDEGYDLSFKREGQGVKTRYTAFAFDRQSSPISDDAKVSDEVLDYIMANPLPDILQFFSYEHLEKLMSGGAEDTDEELDEGDDDGKYKHRKRGGAEAEGEDEEIETRKAKRRRDEDEDEVEDEDEPRSRKTKRPVKDEDEVEETDEEEVEDDPPPKRKTKRPARNEDEDEDEPRARKTKRRADEDEDVDDSEVDEDEAANDDDEPPKRKVKRASRDEDEDEDEPRRGKIKRATLKGKSELDEDESDEDEPPRRRTAAKPKASGRRSRDEDDD